jgi:hypothetical protein
LTEGIENSKAPIPFRFEPAYTTTRNYPQLRKIPTYGCMVVIEIWDLFLTRFVHLRNDVRIKKATPLDGERGEKSHIPVIPVGHQ